MPSPAGSAVVMMGPFGARPESDAGGGMGMSFGERVTGFFVAGAVAVVAASCAAVETGPRPDRGGAMSAAGGLSNGGRGGSPRPWPPRRAWRPRRRTAPAARWAALRCRR
ncbi:hypothetical protein DN402_27685 [Streptomyces sp. SW4]|nr:hypothetical protein DN402_27685 [Streptomyces sp. SW4]